MFFIGRRWVAGAKYSASLAALSSSAVDQTSTTAGISRLFIAAALGALLVVGGVTLAGSDGKLANFGGKTERSHVKLLPVLATATPFTIIVA